MYKIKLRMQKISDAKRFYEISSNHNFIFLDIQPKSIADERKWLKQNAKRRKENTGARNDLGSLAENYGFILLEKIFGGRLKYWRTKAKAEVDFVIEKEQSFFPVEIKYSSKRLIGKSLYSFINKFNPPAALILTKDYLGKEKIKNTKVKFIPLSYF